MKDILLALWSRPLREATLIELVGAIVFGYALHNLLWQVGLALFVPGRGMPREIVGGQIFAIAASLAIGLLLVASGVLMRRRNAS